MISLLLICMMNINGNQPPAVDESDSEWENWINEYLVENYGDSVVNSGVDTTTINHNYPSQSIVSTINTGTSSIGGLANQPQGGIFQEIMTLSNLTPNNTTTTLQRSGQNQILIPAPNFVANPVAQNSQSHRITEYSQYHQNQPLLHQVFKKNANFQQPPTHPLATQSNNITFSDQNSNQIYHQMPSDQILPCTRPVVNMQTGSLQNSQASRVQIQQNPNKRQLQFQQGNVDLSAPVGFATPGEFSSSVAWREYVFRQIRKMKERYFNELLKIHHKATYLRSKATNIQAAKEYENVQTFLEKMMTFLNSPNVDSIPKNDQGVYNYMTLIVNYVSYHMNKNGGSSQPPKGPQMQPNGPRPVNLQHMNQPNLEANTMNLNHNFHLRKPRPRGRMPSLINDGSFQTGMTQNPGNNPLQIGSFKTPQPRANVSGFPMGLFSNTNVTNFSSRPINHQLPVANQKLNLDKMKQPMQANESKVGQTMSPLGSMLVNQGPLTQFPVKPVISQQTGSSPQWSGISGSSSVFDVNNLLSPESIARSPFLLSSSPTPSNQSPVSTIENPKGIIRSMDRPGPCKETSQEAQTPKDSVSRLADVVKSVSSKAINSSLIDITSIEKVMDYIPDFMPINPVGSCTLDDKNIILEYYYEPQRNIRRKMSNVSSASNNQFVFEERPKVENKGAILDEIKEINRKLLETSMDIVSDPLIEAIKVNCVFKNVCFRNLLGPLCEKMPVFVIQLLVPVDYPASSPKVLNSGLNVLSEPWGKLYEETLTRFDLSLRGVTAQFMSLGEMAKKWDSSARFVMTEFVQKKGGKSFSSKHGSWENCINSSSGSN